MQYTQKPRSFQSIFQRNLGNALSTVKHCGNFRGWDCELTLVECFCIAFHLAVSPMSIAVTVTLRFSMQTPPPPMTLHSWIGVQGSSKAVLAVKLPWQLRKKTGMPQTCQINMSNIQAKSNEDKSEQLMVIQRNYGGKRLMLIK